LTESNHQKEENCPLFFNYLIIIRKIIVYLVLVLFIIFLLFEILLRSFTTITVQNLVEQGFTHTVKDPYTAWRNRPNVGGAEPLVTNNYGLHENREVQLKKDTDYRVGVIGSSVTIGLGMNFDSTIPYGMNREFSSKGFKNVDVVNFGNHGFNILNVSGYIQTYIHQFELDAIVLIADLQIVNPKYPVPVPSTSFGNSAVKKLNMFEKFIKIMTQYSVTFVVIDNPQHLKNRMLNLSSNFLPKITIKANGTKSENNIPVMSKEESEKKIEEYKSHKNMELGAHLASLASFCNIRGIKFYVVTPYSPLEYTNKEFKSFANHVVGHIEKIFGSREEAWKQEVLISTEIINKFAKDFNYRVVNSLSQNKDNITSTKNKDFSADGIHLNKEGYLNLGKYLADEMIGDNIFTRGKNAF